MARRLELTKKQAGTVPIFVRRKWDCPLGSTPGGRRAAPAAKRTMTFVNASLIFGSALIAVPIILHLIMRRKPVRLEFPALRFIRQRHDTNQRRLRLRHLLLLLLRMAAIAPAGLRAGAAERENGRQRPGQPGIAGGRRLGLRCRAAHGLPARKQDAAGGGAAVGPVAAARSAAGKPDRRLRHPRRPERLRRRSRAGQATHPAAGNGDPFPAPDAGRRGRRSSAGPERAGARGRSTSLPILPGRPGPATPPPRCRIASAKPPASTST